MKIFKLLIHFIFIFLFLISIFILSCKKNNNLKENHIDQNIKEEKFDIQNDFYNSGFIYGNNLDEIKKNLGEPKKIKITEFENIHIEGQIDEIYELFYDGLYYKTYKISSDKRELMMQITISSNKYETKYDLKVEDDKQKVIDKLGSPNQDKDNIMYYIGEEMGPVGYQFNIENNKIVNINWYGYID